MVERDGIFTGFETDDMRYLDESVGDREIRTEMIGRITRMKVNLGLAGNLGVDLGKIKSKVLIRRDWLKGKELDFSTLGALNDGVYYTILKVLLHAKSIKKTDQELVCGMLKTAMVAITMDILYAIAGLREVDTKELTVLVEEAIQSIIDSLRIDLFPE